MNDWTGYPTVECSECGASDTTVVQPVDLFRQFGPGERAVWVCLDCAHQFIAIVPEPPDNYEGDGVFAENH